MTIVFGRTPAPALPPLSVGSHAARLTTTIETIAVGADLSALHAPLASPAIKEART